MCLSCKFASFCCCGVGYNLWLDRFYVGVVVVVYLGFLWWFLFWLLFCSFGIFVYVWCFEILILWFAGWLNLVFCWVYYANSAVLGVFFWFWLLIDLVDLVFDKLMICVVFDCEFDLMLVFGLIFVLLYVCCCFVLFCDWLWISFVFGVAYVIWFVLLDSGDFQTLVYITLMFCLCLGFVDFYIGVWFMFDFVFSLLWSWWYFWRVLNLVLFSFESFCLLFVGSVWIECSLWMLEWFKFKFGCVLVLCLKVLGLRFRLFCVCLGLLILCLYFRVIACLIDLVCCSVVLCC